MTNWIERIEAGEREAVFREIFDAICSPNFIAKAEIIIFFEKTAPEVAAHFLTWIIAREYLAYLVEELQMNFTWSQAVFLLQCLDPQGEVIGEYLS